MKNKTITITLIALLTLSTFGLLFTTLLTPAAAAYSPVDLSKAGPYAISATPEMIGEKEVAFREYAAEVGAAEATQASPIGDPATINDKINVTVSDMGLGVDYDETFVVIMNGTHGNILIEKAAFDAYDPITDEYVFPNPYNCWRDEDRISTDQLAYLLDEFDNNIYPTDTEIFGEPLPRGADGQKVWVLIHNIRDESYYDCAMTWYVAGYFSSSEDAENNKNMMHIDSYDWGNRVGPGVARPYLYESVFAHEFQHLIHFDQDPDEPSWVDEACAEMAMYMCGYGHPSSHIMYYFAYHAFTSLTFWGGQLEDYGASYLFALYLYEHYGGAAFFTALLQEQENGILGIQNTLDNFTEYEGITFDEIYDDWTIANYLDDPSIEDGKYGYDLIEMGSADTNGWTLDYSLAGFWGEPIFKNEWALEGWWGTPQPYTPHYYRFTTNKWSKMYIDGEDFAGTTAFSGTYEWYSDAEAWAWRSFNQTFAIPAGGATLNFMTYFEIEYDWDYGYVEVFDHDAGLAGEWYTLNDPSVLMFDDDGYLVPMADYVAIDQDNPNTPDGREPTAYNATERWHAFTGNSGGWIPVSMDLGPFAGHTIDLYFTTWQDGAFTLQMMYVDDIEIPEIGFFDDVEAGEGNWTTNGWSVTDGILDNDFEVTILTLGYPLKGPEVPIEFQGVKHIWVQPGTQSGERVLSKTRKNQIYLAIVSNCADHILPSGYILGVEKKRGSWWNWWNWW